MNASERQPPSPRRARWPWALLAALLLAPPLLALVLASSPRLLGRVLDTFVPGLEFASVTRAPEGGVLIEAPRYRGAGIDFRAARLRLGLAFGWPAEIRLAPLSVESARLELAPRAGTDDSAWPRLPFVLRAPALDLRDVRVVLPGREVRVTRLAGDLALGPRGLGIEGLTLELGPHAASGSLDYQALGAPSIEAALRWRGVVGDRASEAEVALRGPLAALKVHATVRAPWPATLDAELDLAATPPRAKGELRATPPATAPVGALRVSFTGDAAALQVAVETTLAAAPARLAGRFTPQGQGISGEFTWGHDGTPVATGRGDFALDADGLRLALDANAPFSTSLRARLLLEDAGPRLGARLSWRGARWPLDETRMESDGALRLRGRLDQGFTVDGGARLRGAPLGEVEASLHGAWHDDALRVRALDLRLLRGQAGLRGDVRLAPTLCASGAFSARGLDVAVLAPGLESALGLRGEAQACREGDAWRARLALDALEGAWRGEHVRGAGRYVLDAAGQRIEGLALRVGGNRLTLDARLAGAALAGEFTLAAPRLAELAPELRGRLEAGGTLGGSLAAPRVTAALHGAGLAFDAWRATALEGTADLDLERARPSSLSLSLAELAQGERRLGDLGFALSGDARAQRIDLTLQGGAPHLALALEGAWRAPGWEGRLVSARVGEPSVGDWRLVAPAALSLRPDALSLERACLAQRRGRVCLAVPRWRRDDAAVALDVDALPLTLFGPWLPTTLAPRGTLGLHAALEREGERWRGQGDAQVTRGGFRYHVPGEPVRDLPLRRAALRFTLDDTRLDARVDAALADWLALDGTLEAGLEADAAWRGRFTLDLPDIAWIEGFVPELAGSSGAARLALALQGTRAAPEIAGELAARGATLRVPRTGTVIEQLAVDFRGWPARGLALNGGGKLGDGQLALSGDVRLPGEGGLTADLRVTGENLALLRLPDVEADASPALTLTIAPQRFDVAGSVRWPRVQVRLRELPTQAVATSSDEVIVGRAATGVAAAPPRTSWFTDTLSADLDFVLGDEVELSAAGLEAKVAGAVHWTKPRHDERGRGSGRLTVKSGSYKAYGQSLSVKSGALMFAGAIDNPALDVRAVRPDIDTTAGVRVTGNLRAPRFQLFAEPSLPDAEILSYLVTGHGLGEASSGEAGLIARAALGLGTERAAVIAGQLSGLFALDELGINAGTTARTSSIVAGKRLTPKLTVRSEFNPFEKLWTFFVNYKLTPRWSVEAQTGAGQGADLIYSVERDSFSGATTPAPPPPR